MLTEWRAKRLMKPSLLLHPLGMQFGELAGQLLPRKPRAEVSDWLGCTDHVFEDADYKLIATVEGGSVAGDLLCAVLRAEPEFWASHADSRDEVRIICERARELAASEGKVVVRAIEEASAVFLAERQLQSQRGK